MGAAMSIDRVLEVFALVSFVALLPACSNSSLQSLHLTAPQMPPTQVSSLSDVIAAQSLIVARGTPPLTFFRARGRSTRMMRRPGDIYVSDIANDVVDGYDAKSGALTEQLTGFELPQGIATDRTGNLYVADTAASAVFVFPPGATSPSLTLADTGWYPTDVAVSAAGEVAVANEHSISDGPGSVAFYKPGQTRPFHTVIAGSDIGSTVWFCSYDANGNLFADGGKAPAHVAMLPHGGTANKFKPLGIANVIIAGGIQIAGNGDILVLDQQVRTIYRYWRRHSAPVGTTVLTNSSDPVTFALLPKETLLFDADYGFDETAKFAFPAGGYALYSIAVYGAPIGVAIAPGAPSQPNRQPLP